MKDVTVSLVEGQRMLDEAFAIREAVFVVEQHVEHAAEFDDLDQTCEHLLARVGDQPAGTLRLRVLDGETGKIERVAVRAKARGLGIGAVLIERAILRLQERGLRHARLHAQTHALGFYQKLGFTAQGNVFDEDGIPHRAMWRSLDHRTSERAE